MLYSTLDPVDKQVSSIVFQFPFQLVVEDLHFTSRAWETIRVTIETTHDVVDNIDARLFTLVAAVTHLVQNTVAMFVCTVGLWVYLLLHYLMECRLQRFLQER